MISMNSKGQGFDVFKLLIAAVVAGAILLILLQTLNIIPNLGSKDPNKAASDAVRGQRNEVGIIKTYKDITFDPDSSLNAGTIAAASDGLTAEQVCVAISPNLPNAETNFKVTGGGKIVLYTGFSSQSAKIMVGCDRGASNLATALDDYGYSSDPYSVSLDDCSFEDGTSRVCIVAVIPDQ